MTRFVRLGLLLVMLVAAIAGCANDPAEEAAAPTATKVVTASPPATVIPADTQEPIPEPTASTTSTAPAPATATATAAATIAPFLPADLVPISAESAARLEPLATLPALNGFHVILSPDGNLLATIEQAPADRSWSVQLWDLASGLPTLRLPGGPAAFFSPDGSQIATLTVEGGGTLWNVDSGTGQRIISAENIAAISPSWRLLATIPEVDAAADVTTLEVVPLVTSEPGWSGQIPGHIVALRFSPNQRLLAATTGGVTSLTTIWQVGTGRVLHQIADVDRFTFSPDGRLAAGLFAPDKAIRLMDTQSWAVLPALEPVDIVSPRELAFSADGRLLAAALGSGLAVWDVATGQPLWVGPIQTGNVAFSPSGRLLAGLDHAQGVTVYGVTDG